MIEVPIQPGTRRRVSTHAAAGLERIDPDLQRLGPVGAEAEAGDGARLLGHLELVGPVAREALLRRERLVDALGRASTVLRKWMAGIVRSFQSLTIQGSGSAGRPAATGARRAR